MPTGDIGIFKEGYTINYSDSSLSDGDGIEYILYFGPLKSSAPKGTIGGDGVYRAGKIVVSITGAWSEINTSFLAIFSDFHTGDRSTMNEVKGKIGGTRKTSKSWQITFDKLLVQLNSTDAMQEITGNCEIVTTAGNQTIGLLDNSQDVFGNGSGVLPSGESYSWTIDPNIPLKQQMEFGCAQTL